VGSLRNPVGPLPSTIYWRRRAIAASLIALLALLVVWVVTAGGGDNKDEDTSDGANPAKSITPGPSGSGPAISEQPGGRGDSGGTGGNDGGQSGTAAGGDGGGNGDTEGTSGSAGTGSAGTGSAGTGSDGGNSDGASDGAGSAGAAGSSSGGGTGTGGAGGTSSGRQVSASSTLPDCVRASLELRLSTTKVPYAPGEKPEFRLTAKNTSAITCKADFGPKAMVLTVFDVDDDKVWSSTDCPPKTGAALFEVPAGGTITREVEWNRKRSAPKCATPPAGGVAPGTYVVEVEAAGASVKQDQQSIRLEKD
jgi:hypothetical protein